MFSRSPRRPFYRISVGSGSDERSITLVQTSKDDSKSALRLLIDLLEHFCARKALHQEVNSAVRNTHKLQPLKKRVGILSSRYQNLHQRLLFSLKHLKIFRLLGPTCLLEIQFFFLYCKYSDPCTQLRRRI